MLLLTNVQVSKKRCLFLLMLNSPKTFSITVALESYLNGTRHGRIKSVNASQRLEQNVSSMKLSTKICCSFKNLSKINCYFVQNASNFWPYSMNLFIGQRADDFEDDDCGLRSFLLFVSHSDVRRERPPVRQSSDRQSAH